MSKIAREDMELMYIYITVEYNILTVITMKREFLDSKLCELLINREDLSLLRCFPFKIFPRNRAGLLPGVEGLYNIDPVMHINKFYR